MKLFVILSIFLFSVNSWSLGAREPGRGGSSESSDFGVEPVGTGGIVVVPAPGADTPTGEDQEPPSTSEISHVVTESDDVDSIDNISGTSHSEELALTGEVGTMPDGSMCGAGCQVISIDAPGNIGRMFNPTGAPLGNYSERLTARRRRRNAAGAVSVGDEANVQIFIPQRTAREIECFKGAQPYAIGETEAAQPITMTVNNCPVCPPPPPASSGSWTMEPAPEGGNLFRAYCSGGGVSCWGGSVACPNGVEMVRGRGWVNTEYQVGSYVVPNWESLWGAVQAQPWGNVRMMVGRIGDDRSSLVGEVNGRLYSEGSYNHTLPENSSGMITAGCRDGDSSCSGPTCGCSFGLEIECDVPPPSGPTTGTPGTITGTPPAAPGETDGANCS